VGLFRIQDILGLYLGLVSGNTDRHLEAGSQNCEKRLLASSRLSVRTEQLGSDSTDFHEI